MGVVRQRIIDVARAELGPGDNRDIKSIKELDKYFIDTGKSSYGADKTTSWCGLFSCWVLKQAQLNVKWGINQFGSFGIVPIGSGQVELVDSKRERGKGIMPGDICVIEHRIHHFVVEYAYQNDELMVTISGNYLGRKHDCIRRTREYTRSGVWYYYRILQS
jgi:hypothetical protein